jgi:hypothetical protein
LAKVTAVDEVYQLVPNVDDPRYEGFGFVRDDSTRGKYGISADFMPDDIPTKGRAWTVTRMAGVWNPEPVIGRVRPYNDYPCVNLDIPAFSQRAVEVLRDLLEPNGELLPLVSEVGSYYAYNITTIADALDPDPSEVEWYDDARDIAISVERYVFRPERLRSLSIFRLVERPALTYVTNVFAERVRAHRLRGFVFRKLWPHAPEADPEGEEGAAEATAQSVIVQLATAKPKPSKAEKQQVDGLMDQIDTQILATEREGTYLGSLEGNEYARGECRLFFSCPNADVLADWLAPLLRGGWGGRVTVTRRRGAFDDAEAPEERAVLPSRREG